jgi:hypothetical protein
LFLGLVLPALAAPNFKVPPSPLEAKPGDVQAFYGQVKTVDGAARTITLGMPMLFTFNVSGETQITLRRGGAVPFEAIQPGAGTQIEARRTAKGWTALKIKLERGATFPDEMAARTPQGKTVTGPIAADFIVYEPPAETFSRNTGAPHASGFYVVSVRPDGTVASVRTLKSIGDPGVDARAHVRLRQFKFRAGSVTEVRIPLSIHANLRQ